MHICFMSHLLSYSILIVTLHACFDIGKMICITLQEAKVAHEPSAVYKELNTSLQPLEIIIRFLQFYCSKQSYSYRSEYTVYFDLIVSNYLCNASLVYQRQLYFN
jgi:hypothetical protein